jgi:hypothetical protein
MTEPVDNGRRRFLGAAAVTLAAAELGLIGTAEARSSTTRPSEAPSRGPLAIRPFGDLKQIHAGVLDVGYAEAGPAGGPAVILLHGWPYDIHSFVDVTPLLAARGYRVIVSRISAAMARRAFFQVKRSGMASNRQSLSISSL